MSIKKILKLYKELSKVKAENAELKKKNVQLQDAVTMQMYVNKANKEQLEEQIEKIKNLQNITDSSDKRLEPILQKLKDLGVIKSWYYNGTYHAC